MADKPAEAAAAPKAKSGEVSPMVFMGVGIALMLVMMAAGFAMAFYVLPDRISTQLSQKFKADLAAQNSATNPVAPNAPAPGATTPPERATQSGATNAETGGKPDDQKQFILSEIMVNVNGTNMSRLLKASLYFDASDATRKKLEDNRAKIIDAVSSILRSKTLEEYESKDITGVLKNEIVSRVNAIIPGGGVENVYFLDLVIQ